MGKLFDFCAHRAALMGRNPPRGEALAAKVRAELRAISELEQFAQKVRIACADERREIQVRGIEEGTMK